VISACPSNISQCDVYTATWTDPTATGTPAASVVCVPASGSTFSAGTTSVTCTATNSCGSSSCSFNVTINETPVISACPSNISQCDVYTATWTDPTATATPAASVVCVPASGSTFIAGVTTVTCTATNSCGSDQCSFTVTITTSPTVSAGADQSICYTGTATLNGSFGGGASSATWSSLGDGSFDNVNLMNAVYTPGPSDITGGTVTLVLTTNDPAGPCVAATDQMVITILTSVPAKPAVPTGPATACTGDVFSYSIPAVPSAASYTWTSLLPAYASVTGSGTSASINFFGVLPGGTSSWPFSVIATNACGNSPARTFAPRNKISQPVFASGLPVVVCQNTNGVVYAVSSVAGAISYNWTITGSGATISGSNTGSSISVNFGTFTSVTISVTATNLCMTTAARVMTVTSVPAIPGTINGASYVCPNGTYQYSVIAVPGATSYLWTGPAGSSVSGTSNIVNITFGASVPGGSLVSVRAVGGCANNSAIRSKGVASGIPNIPSAISGPASGQCGETGVSYSIIPNNTPPVTSYNWSVNNGASITGPNNLSGISVNFPGSFTSVTVSVAAINGCGTGATRTLNVTGAPALPPVITGNNAPCANSVSTYSTVGSTGASSYNWTVPAGATILGSPNGPSILLQWGSTSGNVSVQAVNSCGVSSFRSLPCVISCRQSQVSGSASGLNAEVYPNPATEKATLKFTAASASQVHLNMTSVLGQSVMTTEVAATEGINMIDLDLNNLAKGVYMLNIMSGDNNEQIRVVVE
ncbi:MAG: T9SS type A sorting domain-containing protein, partial [Bacteroidetes bacterium]|nr:T9SS type A sorting domain-containing protein [Bacteroidota bacterium]